MENTASYGPRHRRRRNWAEYRREENSWQRKRQRDIPRYTLAL